MTKSHPSAKKAKARGQILTGWETHEGEPIPALLCLPMPTLKSARARMRFERADNKGKAEALAKAIFALKNPDESWAKWQRGSVAESCRDYARAVLRVIEGECK